MVSCAIPISNEEILTIKEIIEDNNGSDCSFQQNFQTLWYTTIDGSEFRISFLGNLQIIISRVEFAIKRKGTLTCLCDFLKKMCLKYSIKEILIQSTQTKEIVDFCNKYGFRPCPYASFELDGIVLGDYSFVVTSDQ